MLLLSKIVPKNMLSKYDVKQHKKSPPMEGFFVDHSPQPSTPKQEKKPMDLETLIKEHPSLVSQIKQDGAKAERSRLEAILAMPEAAERQKLALEIALHTEMSAVEAQHILACATPEKNAANTSFERVMASIPNPTITPASDDPANDVDALAARIAAAV